MNILVLDKEKIYLATIDNIDFEEINKYRWRAQHFDNGKMYAIRTYIPRGSTISMHRQIMKAAYGENVDHKDNNGLNNRRDNLRICTQSQNNANMVKSEGYSSIYKGVYYNTKTKKWRAQVTNGKNIFGKRNKEYLGYFSSELEAAKVYDERMKEIYGEFARVNFQ